jgi:hypothetical protein
MNVGLPMQNLIQSPQFLVVLNVGWQDFYFPWQDTVLIRFLSFRGTAKTPEQVPPIDARAGLVIQLISRQKHSSPHLATYVPGLILDQLTDHSIFSEL